MAAREAASATSPGGGGRILNIENVYFLLFDTAMWREVVLWARAGEASMGSVNQRAGVKRKKMIEMGGKGAMVLAWVRPSPV